MSVFVVVIALWFGLSCVPYWLLASSAHAWTSLAASLAVWLLLPLAVAAFVAQQIIHPAWHRPGVPPRARTARGSTTGDAAAESDREGSRNDAQAASEERAFEAVVEGETVDIAGELGAVVGGAVPFYAGRTTNPLKDYNLRYSHVTIPCTEGFTVRGAHSSTPHAQVRNNMSSAAPSVYHLRGWLIPGATLGRCRPRTLVLMVHGAGRDRRTFMRHASLFHEAGYTTLLMDCREHGCSDAQGRGVGFCTREAIDVIHAARFAKMQLHYDTVVLCGTSQGAASSIIAAVLSEEIELHELPARVSPNGGSRPRGRAGSPVSDAPSAPRSRSRTYRASMTRTYGDAGSDEEMELIEHDGNTTPTAEEEEEDSDEAANTRAPSHTTGPLISGVISENAFVSREACWSDLLHTLLGRPPRLLAPLLAPMQRTFVACIALLVRYRLGLFSPTRTSEWAHQWRRAHGVHESLLRKPRESSFGVSGYSTHSPMSASSHPSPSSAHMPLPPLLSCLPLSRFPAALLDLSPLDLVSRISPRPLLLMHGLLDRIVPPSHSQALYSAARDPKKLFMVPHAHHTALIDADREGWSNTVLTWLQQHGF